MGVLTPNMTYSHGKRFLITFSSGFDPIFFLHHANVDRLLSLWVAINPDFSLTSGSSGKGSQTIEPGVTIDDKTRTYPVSFAVNITWLR